MIFGIVLIPIGALADKWPQTLIDAAKAFDRGDYETSIRLCTKEIDTHPNSDAAYFNRGASYASVRQYDRAIADFTMSLKLRPEQWMAYYSRGHANENAGNFAKAVADYNQAILEGPRTEADLAEVFNQVAWLLATCPEAEYRDGAEAVKDAKEAWEASVDIPPAFADTLAAAYAEAGDFKSAVKWEQFFLGTPKLSDKDATDAQARLALYQAGKAYHEKR